MKPQADTVVVNSRFTEIVFANTFKRLYGSGVCPQVLYPTASLAVCFKLASHLVLRWQACRTPNRVVEVTHSVEFIKCSWRQVTRQVHVHKGMFCRALIALILTALIKLPDPRSYFFQWTGSIRKRIYLSPWLLSRSSVSRMKLVKTMCWFLQVDTTCEYQIMLTYWIIWRGDLN